MIYREADGSDKIVAFERGMSGAQAHLAFETPDVSSVIVDETYLVSYSIGNACIAEWLRLRLYNGPGTAQGVKDFLKQEADTFGKALVCSTVSP